MESGRRARKRDIRQQVNDRGKVRRRGENISRGEVGVAAFGDGKNGAVFGGFGLEEMMNPVRRRRDEQHEKRERRKNRESALPECSCGRHLSPDYIKASKLQRRRPRHAEGDLKPVSRRQQASSDCGVEISRQIGPKAYADLKIALAFFALGLAG